MKKYLCCICNSVVPFILLFLPFDVNAIYPGTYDHIEQIAYILEIDSNGGREISKADFKNKSITNIGRGKKLRSPSLSKDKQILSYVGRRYIHFVDLSSIEELYKVQKRAGAKIIWSNNGKIVSYNDILEKVILEIDLDSKNFVRIPFGNRLLHTKWNKECSCFLYQVVSKKVRDTVGHLDGKIMRSVDGELQEYKSIKTLTMSPDGRYYYEGKVYPEMGNSVSFYTNHDDKLIASFNASTSLANADVLWGKDTVRFLYEGGVFNLKTGKLITYSHNFWPEEGTRPKTLNPRKDVAADRTNHVLMWNKEKKIFEVEDINTGKIVKTYKKFW